MYTISELGPRLRTIAGFVPPGARVGDIGTDHAYLPIALLTDGKIKGAVGIDVHKGPFRSAAQAVQSKGLSDRIDIRFGDGLKPLKPEEVDTLVLAGMGGVTMLEILHQKPEVLQEVNTLILQPQGAECKVRKSLSAEGWRLKAEVLVEEAERVYMIIVFTREEGLTNIELEEKIKWWQDKVLNHLGPDKRVPGVNPGYISSIGSPNVVNNSGIPGVIQRYIWEYGPMILEHGGGLLSRLIKDHHEQLGYQLKEMRKGKSEKVSVLMQDKKVQLQVLETLAQLVTAEN